MSEAAQTSAQAAEKPATAAGAVLLREDRGGICRLTLNRPKSRNALSDELIAELQAQLDAIGGDASVRAVIISGAGPAYCAGHDLKEVRAKSGLDDFRDLFVRCSKMMASVVKLPQPVIAAVRGMATAAGCQLAASCDLVVAAEGASFATPGVHIGLFCSTPMVALSRKVGRQPAMEMLLTGAPVSAAEAHRIGLVNHVVTPDGLDAKAQELARAIAGKSPKTIAIGKEAFYRQLEMPLEEAYDYASEVMAQNMRLHDAQEGIDAFISKRKPDWKNK